MPAQGLRCWAVSDSLSVVLLPEVIDRLEAAYGRPRPPKITDPFEMVLLENVAYLVSDEQREAAFKTLRSRIGTTPARILSAGPDVLLDVARVGGMLPEQRVKKLLRSAQIAAEKFSGDLRNALKQPLPQAKRVLKLFPGIGEPGSEKILLFTGTHPILALESNGLRALVRLGFGSEQKNYAATYRSAQDAVKDQVERDCAWLMRAHQLLRRHGQELCKRSRPLCASCPLTAACRYYQTSSRVPWISPQAYENRRTS